MFAPAVFLDCGNRWSWLTRGSNRGYYSCVLPSPHSHPIPWYTPHTHGKPITYRRPQQINQTLERRTTSGCFCTDGRQSNQWFPAHTSARVLMRFCATLHSTSYLHPRTRTAFPFEHKYAPPLRNHFGRAALNRCTDPKKYHVEETMCIHKK